jgi:hypothetical protein
MIWGQWRGAEWGRTLRGFFCVSRLSGFSNGLFVLFNLDYLRTMKRRDEKRSKVVLKLFSRNIMIYQGVIFMNTSINFGPYSSKNATQTWKEANYVKCQNLFLEIHRLSLISTIFSLLWNVMYSSSIRRPAGRIRAPVFWVRGGYRWIHASMAGSSECT